VLVVLARHAHSQLNLEHRINGDPAVPVHITADGQDEARELGLQLANVPIELCVHTRFCRTEETAELALAGRDVPVEVEPLLDDIDVGELEGQTVDEYHAWKAKHVRSDPFPGGESLDEAAKRYAEAFRRLAARNVGAILVVCHEIPIRYALNATAGSDSFDGPVHTIPNALPFLFDEHSLVRAADGIDRLLSTAG
jgi:2,3-bisphosphoglycerate-dependent phosphoglycerate mutase